eukprot:754001-Prorocentrum_minimum.AAC.2
MSFEIPSSVSAMGSGGGSSLSAFGLQVCTYPERPLSSDSDPHTQERRYGALAPRCHLTTQ